MFWEEDEDDSVASTGEIVDLSFALAATRLPAEHAYALSQAVLAHLPWFIDEPGCGLHQIHGAESGNGWQRPDDDAEIYISKRTRLTLRLPQQRVADAEQLSGRQLDLDGYTLEIGGAKVRQLDPLATIYARYVVTGADESEEQFLERAVSELQEIGVRCKKILCGRSHAIRLPDGELATRSLMLADIGKEESLQVQQRGLGEARHLGCGLFVPHKGIKRI